MRLFQIIKDYRVVLNFFFITVFLSSNLAGQNKNMVFRTISKEQGLTNNYINAISQDRQGFLWIGTWNGLFRYDGYQFKSYKPVESDPATISNGIRFFAEDKNDRIWIVSPSGLTMFDKKKERFKCVHTNDSLTGDNFTSLLLDSKGILWLGTRLEGIWTLPVNDTTDFSKTKPNFKRFEHDNNNPKSVSTNSILGAFEDQQSNIWITASNKIIDQYNPLTGTFEHYPIKISNIEKQTNTITMNLEDSDGSYWLCSSGAGLISWDIKQNVFKQYVNEPGKNSISANVINHIRQAGDGILWISTDGGGVSLYNKKTGVFDYCKYEAANPNSLSSDGINLTFEDRSGVIWIGNTSAGLNQDEAKKTNFGLHRPILSDNNSLSYKSVTSIIEDKERNFWIGTDGGGLNFWDKKTQKFRHFLNDPKNSNSISGNADVCLAQDYKGNIWIGTYAHGLNCYKRKEDTFVRFTNDPTDEYSISSNNIWAVLEDSKHNLWVATLEGTLNLYDRNTNRFYQYKNNPVNPNSFSEKYTTNLFEDSRHYLWIATSSGLEMVKLGDYNFNQPFPKLSFNHYRHKNDTTSLSNDNIYCVFEDHEGTMWFGSDGGGLISLNMKTNTFTSYSDKDGLADMSIKAILEDNDFNLWVSTTNGVTEFNPKTKSFHTYNYTDGLQDYAFSNANCKSTDGKLLFGGMNGFNMFDPKSLTTNSIPPQVVLTDLKVYNNSVAVGQEIDGNIILKESMTLTDALVLSYKMNSFSIEFTALDFTNPEKNSFAYKMEGFEDQWHYSAAKNRIATYTNINPGEYTFRVKASNNDGIWNDHGTSLKIIILPSWWQTLWFRLILLAVIAGIVYLIYTWRVQVRELAAQKMLDTVMERERNLLRTLIDLIPDYIYLKDTESRFIVANKALMQSFGKESIDEIYGKTDFNFHSLENARVFFADEQEIIHSGRPLLNKEEPVVEATGQQRWNISTKIPFRDQQGTIVGLVGIGHDITELKRAEEAMKSSEKKLEELFESAPVGYHEIDKLGNIIAVNQTELKMLGYSFNEMIGWPAWEFISDNEESRKRVFHTLAGNIPPNKNSEQFFTRKDGTSFPALVDDVLLQNEHGVITGIRTTILDITKRKQAEEALRETRDYLESLLSFANAPIMVWDNNNRITRFNLAFERMTGYTMYDVMGNYPEMLFPVEMREELSALISRTSDGENLISVEMPVLCKDGSVHIVLWNTANIYAADNKTIIATIAHGQDITTRKHAEDSLKESELRFRSLYENATIGIYRTTPDGKILLANPALVKMLGYTSFEKLAEVNLEKNGFESVFQRKEFLEKIERDGEINSYDSKWIRQDGTHIFVLESARAIRDSNGKTLYYDGTAENITERKSLQGQLLQTQKVQSIGTLAGGIAHDFNNILGIILTYTSILERSGSDEKKISKSTKAITQAVSRGAALVRQILTFARQSGVVVKPMLIPELVREIVGMLKETFPGVIEFKTTVENNVPLVNADHSQIHQVLLNLCVNARDAMPKGGIIGIEVKTVASNTLIQQFPEAKSDRYVSIGVSDTGIGMDEATMSRIFDPFFTTKEQGKGTGLGLSVVYGVIQDHHGFISVESKVGQGTTFHLYLPVMQKETKNQDIQKIKTEERQGGSETILFVEDEQLLREVVQSTLEANGYTVLLATNGQDAVEIYKKQYKDIALVLSDIGLPKLGGIDVYAMLKEINTNIKIIFASGFISQETKSELFKEGVKGFIQKPYGVSEVLQMVREVLNEKGET